MKIKQSIINMLIHFPSSVCDSSASGLGYIVNRPCFFLFLIQETEYGIYTYWDRKSLWPPMLIFNDLNYKSGEVAEQLCYTSLIALQKGKCIEKKQIGLIDIFITLKANCYAKMKQGYQNYSLYMGRVFK